MNTLATTRTRPTGRGRRVLLGAAAVLVSGLATAGWLQPASAATTIDPFAGLTLDQPDCASLTITAADGAVGARFYEGSHRVRVPSRALAYDEFGLVELRAEARTGYRLTRTHIELTAPSSCSADPYFYLYDPDSAEFPGVDSWCDDDPNPVMSTYLNGPGSRYPVPATWTATRVRTGRVVAHDAWYAFSFDTLATPLPAGLPYGRYRIGLTLDEAPTVYPASYPVEHYRCVRATAGTGRVTFRVPAGGPGVTLTLGNVVDTEGVAKVVTLRAGERYRLRTDLASVQWSAKPRGNHVGSMGSGEIVVPQPRT